MEANEKEIKLPRPEDILNGFCTPITGLTHIMSNEDRQSQLEFVREFVKDFNPIGVAEITMARNIALDYWRVNRLKAVEENIFAYGQVLPDKRFSHEIPKVEHAIGHAHTFIRFSKVIDKVSQIEYRLIRIVERNLNLLMKLQSLRAQRRSLGQLIPTDETRPQTLTAGTIAA